MSTLTVLLKLTPVDLKNIRRDSLLGWLPVIPVFMALTIRWGVPPVTAWLRRETGLDVTPWYPLLMSSFAIMLPGLIGTVTGFLLLDERDEGVMSALLVTPLSPRAYVAYRVGVPLALGFVLTMVTYPLAGITPLSLSALAAAALLGSFGAPFMALFLASFADNKVSGFALMKLMNAVQVIPIVAFFVPMPTQLLAGLFPSYWPMKIVWLAAAGHPYGSYVIPGVIINILAVGALMRRFDRVVHR